MKTKRKCKGKSLAKATTFLKTKGNDPPVGKISKLLKMRMATGMPEV
jgi:hypothetical protein